MYSSGIWEGIITQVLAYSSAYASGCGLYKDGKLAPQIGARAEASVGRVRYKTESGEVKITDGVKLGAGAGSYAWKVKASGSVNILGIKIDIDTAGKAEVEVSIDWSDFKLGW